jgi:NAD(P)-dependent dehydrogenase (short-subunit alcohol dehydrogenase family)
MSLANQTCWVVGGVGVIGRGITRGLLKAGATVIVNSRSEERLTRFSEDLGHPDRLITIKGSLLPGYASKTVRQTLDAMPLNHVVAHGAVRYWGNFGANDRRDESHMIQGGQRGSFLQSMTPEDFVGPASQLASLHFSAAQELIPRIQFSNGPSSYTFVTGDAGGHPKGKRSALGEINTHHVWGLAAALRNERLEKDVNCREIRVRLPVNRPAEERKNQPRGKSKARRRIAVVCHR